MKKVVLIGKLNENTKQINDGLSPYCQVQICADDADIARGIVGMTVPDLVIVSLIGARGARTEIFSMLSREASGVPVVAVGSKTDEDDLRDWNLLGEGLTFLRRPVKLEDIIRTAKEKLGLEGAGRSTRILLVDDDPAMLRIIQPMLTDQYKVMFATSGPKAITSIAQSRPDLILLDYDMPVVDGKMVFEMLRSEEETCDIPIIFLTGLADEAHVQKVLALHPDGYLLKPPAKDRLLAKIGQVLQAVAPNGG